MTVRIVVTNCRECADHLRSLGDNIEAAFKEIARLYDVDRMKVIESYMRTHHRLGHPDEERAGAIIESWDRPPETARNPRPEPHPFDPPQFGTTKADYCGHGALLGTDAFCGRTHDDKVHSFLCPQCERRTRDADDIRNGYCGHCQAITGGK